MAFFRSTAVGVKIDAEASGYKRELQRTKRATRDFHREVDRDLDKVGRAFGVAGKAMAAGLAIGAAAVGGFAKHSLTQFAAFDDKMQQSVAIMDGVGPKIRKQMEDTARGIARSGFAENAASAAESYYFLASAGLDAQQSIKALPQVAKFAKAGMFDMALATDLATDAQSALGLKAADAETNLKNLTRVTDVLVKGNKLANASVEQFSTSLTNKAGAALKTVGKDIEEGTAVLAAYADQGVKGEIAGNALAIVLRDLQTAQLKNTEAWQENSVSTYDARGEMRNMADIVGDLEGLLDGMSDKQKKATLAQLGFKDRSQSFILTLLGTSGAIRQYEKDLDKAGGTTDTVAKKQLESFGQQMQILKNRFDDAAISVGQVLAPEIQALTESDEFESWMTNAEQGVVRLFESMVKTAQSDEFRAGIQGAVDIVKTFFSVTMSATRFLYEHKTAVVGLMGAYFGMNVALRAHATAMAATALVQKAAMAYRAYAWTVAAAEGSITLATKAQIAFNLAARANPIMLVAGAAIGAVAAIAAFSRGQDDAASASDRATEAHKRAQQATIDLQDANLASRSAQVTYLDSLAREKEAIDKAAEAKQKHGAKSEEYKAAQREEARAIALRKQAEKDAGAEMQKRYDLAVKSAQQFKIEGGEVRKSTERLDDLRESLRKYIKLSNDESRMAESRAVFGKKAQEIRDEIAKETEARDKHIEALEKHREAFHEAEKSMAEDVKLFRDQTGKTPANFKPYYRSLDKGLRESLRRVELGIGPMLDNLGLVDATPNLDEYEAKLDADLDKIAGKDRKPIKVPIEIAFGRRPFGDGSIMDMLGFGAGSPGVGAAIKAHGLVGADAAKYAAMAMARGLQITSGHRPGAITSTGHPSDHGTGHALDAAGTGAAMRGYAEMARAAGAKQVIYSPLGWARSGSAWSPIPASAGSVLKDHYNHVHVAWYQRGGRVPGHGTGDTVPAMLEPGEVVVNRRAVNAMGGAHAVDAINRMIPRFQKGGIAGAIAAAQTRSARPVSYLRSLERKYRKQLRNMFKLPNRLKRRNRKDAKQKTLLQKQARTAQKRVAKMQRRLDGMSRKDSNRKARKQLQRQIDAQRKIADRAIDQKRKLQDRIQDRKQRLRDLPGERARIADEIVAIREEIAYKIQEGNAQEDLLTDTAPVDGAAEGANIADLIAQLNSLTTTLNEAFLNETGNVLGGIRVDKLEQHFENAPTPGYWEQATSKFLMGA